jgi:hypothetical protein
MKEMTGIRDYFLSFLYNNIENGNRLGIISILATVLYVVESCNPLVITNRVKVKTGEISQSEQSSVFHVVDQSPM